MESSPLTMTMKGVFNLLERINLRNTGRSGLEDKVRFEEKISFKLTKADGKEVKGN
tara:strand:- start:435 stop:602 length:168 start_codon:yes stop_codon:yes gene_type:complete